MSRIISKQRIYALLMTLGAGILFFRTLRMMFFEHTFSILIFWVISLLVLESIIDLSCILSSIRWFILNKRSNARMPLRLVALAIILHSIRVAIYVFGRTGPWFNFDIKPEYYDSYTFEWSWVYFAAILSALGIIGLIVIWLIIRHRESV